MQANADQQAAKAVLLNAQSTMARVQKLHETRFVAQSELDNAQSALDQARARLAGADAQIASAKANISVLEAQYNEAASSTKSLELARDKAARDLSFTSLRAPFDGVIGNLSGKKGDLVAPGQKIAALVPVDQLYIDANFKETQLAHIKVGETAHIYVDAIDGTKFDGKVASIAPASGAVFSLLPPENATGISPRSCSAFRFASPFRKKHLNPARSVRASASLLTWTRAPRRTRRQTDWNSKTFRTEWRSLKA